ncbi:MAG TPA: NADH-quinone oxidoreductase subunit F, partial [bacterium]|nr:NADH-quinone oxidoreductase subunit F [bacterium]
MSKAKTKNIISGKFTAGSGIKAALEMTPEKVIQEVIDSGLRGKGGAGFPAGLKWRFAANEKSEEK